MLSLERVLPSEDLRGYVQRAVGYTLTALTVLRFSSYSTARARTAKPSLRACSALCSAGTVRPADFNSLLERRSEPLAAISQDSKGDVVLLPMRWERGGGWMRVDQTAYRWRCHSRTPALSGRGGIHPSIQTLALGEPQANDSGNRLRGVAPSPSPSVHRHDPGGGARSSFVRRASETVARNSELGSRRMRAMADIRTATAFRCVDGNRRISCRK